MLVEYEEVAAGAEGGGDSLRPAVEIVERLDDALPGVDEVEAAPSQLAREGVEVRLDPEDRRPALARERERLLGRVDGRDHGTELGKHRGRVARPGLEVEHALALQPGERATHLVR
jgi:hypothetical protein